MDKAQESVRVFRRPPPQLLLPFLLYSYLTPSLEIYNFLLPPPKPLPCLTPGKVLLSWALSSPGHHLTPALPLTRLLGWLRQLLTTLGAIGHRVRERSILLVGIRILSRGVVSNLDLWSEEIDVRGLFNPAITSANY